ncbi:MAG: hypothetical protein COA73_00805 [Candidatus Hydrogenedentota bacterium]|nr:MAG: hypothetical protein COA73_00805 [Candidatus Hydrogenedentota bacterium]
MATSEKAGAKKATAKKRAAKKSPAKKKAVKKKVAIKKRAVTKKILEPEIRKIEEVVLELDTASTSSTKSTSTSLPSITSVQETITAQATRSVRRKDITVFLRQLIMMLDAGTPIIKALTSLSHRGEHRGIRTLVTSIKEYVESGNPLWQAFGREGRYFSPVFVNLIKAAEASGNLSGVLRRLVSYREERERMRRQMQVAMIYPSVLVGVAFTVIVLLSMFVIPEFRKLFMDLDVEIGTFPTIVMAIADLIAWYWWVAVAAVVGVWAGYNFWWIRSPLRRLRSDQLKLKLPIFGRIEQSMVVTEFTRTLAMLLRSGVSMLATLDLCRNSVSNRAFANSIQNIRDSVESGEGMESPLRDAEKKGLIPGVVVDMLMTGEETGSVDSISDQIADSYEEEVTIAIEAMQEALQPIMVVTLGIMVGTLVIAMFMPLVSLIEKISSQGM